MSEPTVTDKIDKLIGLGIIKQFAGSKRPRRFGYSEFIEVLNEGTEPL
jgi:DNA-binding Lrp family transcriptional regulator